MSIYEDFNYWAKDAKKFISEAKFSLCEDHDDGRTNSTVDEETVLDLLMDKYGEEILFRPPPRKWFDLWHKPSGTPINIKVTSMKGADNACNFLALLWSFTDLKISHTRSAKKGKDWSELLSFWTKNPTFTQSEERDYWFFVIDKNNTSNIIVNSLRLLEEPTGNPSNPPFQIDWKKNSNPKQRTFEEAFKLYMDICISDIKKRQASDKLSEAEKIMEDFNEKQ